MGRLRKFANQAPVIFSAHFTAGEAADKQVFTADRDYELLEIIEVHRIAGAASSTAMIEKTPSGTAPGSGTDLHGTAFAADSTADTPVHKTVSNGGLVAAFTTRLIKRGQSLAVDFTGTVTAYEGAFTFVLRPTNGAQSPY